MRLREEMKHAGMLALALPIAAVAVVLLSPLLLAAAIRDRGVTPDEVADVLRLCISGDEWAIDEYDTLTGRKWRNPDLLALKSDLEALAQLDWDNPSSQNAFEALLKRVEALPPQS